MNNPEREPRGYRRKLIKGAGRIFAIAALAVGSSSGSVDQKNKFTVSAQAPLISDFPNEILGSDLKAEYRTLQIIKGNDHLLTDPGETMRFRFEPEKISDGVTEEAKESGYLLFRSGEFANKILLPTPIKKDLKDQLIEVLQPMDKFVDNGHKTEIILFVYDQGQQVRLNGTSYVSKDFKKNIIELSVTPEVDITTAEMKEVVINEASHLLYRVMLTKLEKSEELEIFYQTFLDDADNEIIALSNNPDSIMYRQDMLKILNRMPREHRAQIRSTTENALFRIFTEKSYIGEGGHPWDSSEEFFTSALTVMYRFPKSFIETVSNLSDKDRLIVISFARFVVYQVGEPMFDKELVNYLTVKNG